MKKYLKKIRNILRGIIYRGEGRYCHICEKSFSKFLSRKGIYARENAICPGCNSLERHRIAWYYLKNRTNIFEDREKLILHIAPEECFEPRLRKYFGKNYLTADLMDSNVDVKMDITNIQFPENSFDVIYCAHVLEHVRDDIKALSEFRRVLKNSGWAILIVPLEGEKTIEAPGVTDPEELFRLFGQRDHVRQYGTDFIDRLRVAGFSVTVTTPNDMFTKDELTRLGMLSHSDDIYFCRKK